MSTSAESTSTSEKEKPRKNKFKVIIRRLPPYLTWEELKEQLDPLPSIEYVSYCPADLSFAPHAFGRCYFVFTNENDILEFSEKFNRYIFVDKKGYESAAMVELAMHQKVPRKKREDIAKDIRCGIIEQEPEYLRFLDELEAAKNQTIMTMEEQLRHVQLLESTSKANNIQSTPLTQHLIKLYAEKSQRREEKRKAMDKFRKPRPEKERIRDKHRDSPTERPKPTGSDDEDTADRVMKKLGIGKTKDKEVPVNRRSPPAREEFVKKSPARPEKVPKPSRADRAMKNDADRKKKDRPEREIYRPGQRNRQKTTAADDVI